MENSKPGVKHVYFPNLNGLRSIGAGIVMIGHIEFLKIFWKIPYYQWFPIPGKIGVALFFALSGFLITSLLFQEETGTGTIKLKDFYVRRILRIWPLYYLIILSGLFIFNSIDFLKMPILSEKMHEHMTFTNIVIALLIIPNVTHFYIPYADQRWSIVVEELFYLIQPMIVKTLKRRKPLLVAFSIIVVSPELLSLLVYLFRLQKHIPENILSAIAQQLEYLGCIATGCIFSVLYFQKDRLSKRFIFSRFTQWGVLLILIACLALGKYVYNTDELIDYRLYSFLFAIVVFNASQNPQTIFKLEKPVLNFLGKISYGLYMYHPVCIGLSIVIAMAVTSNLIIMNLIIYTGSIGFTILVSWLSYRYFEGFFLRLKSKFSGRKKKVAMAS